MNHSQSFDEKTQSTDTEANLRCNSCDLNFNTIDDVLNHSSGHQNKESDPSTITCASCSDKFESITLLLEHRDSCHDGSVDAASPHAARVDSDETNMEGKSSPDNHEDTENIEKQSAKRRTVLSNNVNNSRDSFEPPTKRRATPSTLQTYREEIEIDTSRVSSIRLRNDAAVTTQTTQALMNRQDEIYEYLQKIDEKLDCVIKHFNVPCTNTVRLKSFTSNTTRPARRTSASTTNGGEMSNRVNVVLMGDERTNQETGEITQYVISDELVETMYIRSRNRGNFAKQLTYAAFPPEERIGRNCYGRRSSAFGVRKLALDPAKLDAVREAVFQKYPCLDGDEEEQVWRKECVIAIDTALRSEMRTRSSKQDNVEIKFISGVE